MGKIVINTVYNVHMYEHAIIHAPCRKVTYIHLFHSILPLFGVSRLLLFSCIDGHMELPTDDVWQSHMTCGPSV